MHLPAADRPAASIHLAHGQELCARGQRTGRGRTAARGSRVALTYLTHWQLGVVHCL